MFAYIPIIYCFFPETAGRTLEQMIFCSQARARSPGMKRGSLRNAWRNLTARFGRIDVEQHASDSDDKKGSDHAEDV